ncbi:class I SAM-dependent methyltransferase [Streptomyces sp. H27-C3]|uniref:class I SAM-dependent methyltransferase n=1 Tax=Streptomyces sp. H27-C3 TaxID=3046305 RepID=UPI0024B9201A|nr:class I SAM-dependent methyltransferase [Streptomyces sp. H27-C3]MDJ0460242.1 class I SAM-dependent methyltransferase [Streptomyces sp. H27-C3]
MWPSSVRRWYAHEARRLGDQADTLAALLHVGTAYPAGSRVLEVGCGVGAQTLHLVEYSPGAHITAIDASQVSLSQARARFRDHPRSGQVTWRQADLFQLPYAEGSFGHLCICFVLEHLSDPRRALASLRRVLRPGAPSP